MIIRKLSLCGLLLAGNLVISLHVRSASLPAGFVDVVVASGFTNVSCMTFLPDGRILVGQQNGVVRVVKNGTLLSTPLVSLPASTLNERGLVGLTPDPAFAANGFLYVHYTATNPALAIIQRVSRLTVAGDLAPLGTETTLIETDPFTTDREVGGGLRFGPDARLYIGIGQRNSTNDLQNITNLFGKILRLNPDGTIPADNPFFNSATGKQRSIYALGFRNPFSFAFQNGTGRLFENDVGSVNTAAREEINDVQPGLNYGWPICEGNCSPSNPALRDPLYFYLHTNNFNAIVGGDFYNPAVPLFPAQYVGRYFFGDLATGVIQVMDPATTNVSPFATNVSGNFVALQVGPDGALYYLTQSFSPLGGSGFLGKILPGVQPLVPFGSAWKYLDTGMTNIPANWTQAGFDDSSWSNGVAQLGWGANGETTLIRSNRTDGSRIITTYFRKSFVLSNPAPFSNYVASLVRDDGGVVYVNGTEVFRSNMPTGSVSSSNFATLSVPNADERVTYGAVVNPALLLSGTNILAAEIHQQATNVNTDMSFDLGLFGVNGNATLRAITAGNGTITLAYPSWASRFAIESATNLPSATWTSVPTNGATVVGSELQLPVTLTKPQEVFRLRSP